MKPFPYTVTRSLRRKTVAIRVHPDKTIEILAPALLQEREIASIAAAKKRWINRKINELDNCDLQFLKHRFEERERFLYLGKSLILAHKCGRTKVTVDDNSLIVSLPPGLNGEERSRYAQDKLRQFYMKEALVHLRKTTFEAAERYGFKPIYVAIKEYSSRWGCCFYDGRIYFNWRIVMAPVHIIEYVVIHELCHLRVANHSKKFWLLVESILPDWSERRSWLRLNGHALYF